MNTEPETVEPREAHELAASKQAIIVDVREAKAFAEGHIAGAINIPLGELADRVSELPIDQRILTSCGGGSRGPKAAALLREHGVVADVLRGGLRGWTAAGLAVE